MRKALITLALITIAGFMHGAENLFPNGNFAQITNNCPNGWSCESDDQITIIAGGVEANSKTWQIKAAAKSKILIAPVINSKFTGTYTFRGFYQATPQGNLLAKFTLEFLNSQNEVLLTRTQVLPSTQDEWIAFFDQYDAPENSAKVAIKIIVESGSVIKLTDFSFRAGTLKDYASEFSVELPKGKERFPTFCWLSPGDRPHYKSVRKLYNSPRMHAEYAYSNHCVWGDPAFNSLQIVRPNITAEEAKRVTDAWCIMGKDEPTPKRFDGLLVEKANLEKILPDVPYFNNLLPCYASKEIFSDHDAYVQYLIDYRDKFKPKYVTVDYYSLHTKPPIYSPALWTNLYDMQKVYGNSETNWGMILAVLHFGSNRSPSEAELRWQVYSSLAYGAKIIGWFTFLEPIDRKLKPSADAAIQIDGNRSFHYAMLRKLNREILQLGPTLLRLKSTGTFHSPVPPKQIYSFPVKAGNLVNNVTGGMAVVGEFVHKDNGIRYVILTNRDFMKEATLKFTFDPKIKSLREVSRQTGELLPAIILNGDKIFTLKLAAGDGRLFELSTVAGK